MNKSSSIHRACFQKQQSFLNKRKRKYDLIRKKSRKQHLKDVYAYSPQVSKALRPWFLSIETTNDYDVFVKLGWFGSQIRIDIYKIFREYYKFERGEISDTCNNEKITVYFDDVVSEFKCEVPTELVIEVVRFMRQMNRFNETIAVEYFRYYTREEKKRFVRYKWCKRNMYKRKQGSHDRWICRN